MIMDDIELWKQIVKRVGEHGNNSRFKIDDNKLVCEDETDMLVITALMKAMGFKVIRTRFYETKNIYLIWTE